jgi:hypothetical protein
MWCHEVWQFAAISLECQWTSTGLHSITSQTVFFKSQSISQTQNASSCLHTVKTSYNRANNQCNVYSGCCILPLMMNEEDNRLTLSSPLSLLIKEAQRHNFYQLLYAAYQICSFICYNYSFGLSPSSEFTKITAFWAPILCLWVKRTKQWTYSVGSLSTTTLKPNKKKEN